MKLIKPKQISGEIMTLLDEADKEVIIVSPFVQVSEWKKLERTFENLKSRNVSVKFFYRKGNETAQTEIEGLGFNAIPIENLHCKIYYNEKSAIVSSMNLYKYSDENSLDIAYKTEKEQEFKELREFYNRYIELNYRILTDRELLDKLNNDFFIEFPKTKYGFKFKDGELVIYFNNNRYNFYFERAGRFVYMGILSGAQLEYSKDNYKKLFKNKILTYSLIEGKKNHYDLIVSEHLSFLSNKVTAFLSSDYEFLKASLFEFLNTVSFVKKESYSNNI